MLLSRSLLIIIFFCAPRSLPNVQMSYNYILRMTDVINFSASSSVVLSQMCDARAFRTMITIIVEIFTNFLVLLIPDVFDIHRIFRMKLIYRNVWRTSGEKTRNVHISKLTILLYRPWRTSLSTVTDCYITKFCTDYMHLEHTYVFFYLL